jgi:uncharacterized repeat protein (TIGR03843 family)
MCQLWIEVEEGVDLGALVQSEHPDLQRLALLDAVINNADRKGGHLLPTASGAVRAIDHGVCFAVEDKLRTVLWQWRGQPLTPEAHRVLSRLEADLTDELGAELAEHLTVREVRRTVERVRRLGDYGTYPQPSEDWPAVPWPPF